MADQQTEAYRQSTSAIAGAAALYAGASMALVKPDDLLTTFEMYVNSLLGPASAASRRVMSLARQDFYATRTAAAVVGPEPPWVPQPLVQEALRRSVYATAGQTLQDIERLDVPASAALKRAKVQAQGVVIRQVMNSARNSTIATTESDKRALGALYVTREDDAVCSWCLMLASRGPVFGSDSYKDADRLFTGGGTAKSHDSCRCVLKTVYAEKSDLLEQSNKLEAEWRDVNWAPDWRERKADWPLIRRGGPAALNAWRRHVDAERRAGNKLFGGTF